MNIFSGSFIRLVVLSSVSVGLFSAAPAHSMNIKPGKPPKKAKVFKSVDSAGLESIAEIEFSPKKSAVKCPEGETVVQCETVTSSESNTSTGSTDSNEASDDYDADATPGILVCLKNEQQTLHSVNTGSKVDPTGRVVESSRNERNKTDTYTAKTEIRDSAGKKIDTIKEILDLGPAEPNGLRMSRYVRADHDGDIKLRMQCRN